MVMYSLYLKKNLRKKNVLHPRVCFLILYTLVIQVLPHVDNIMHVGKSYLLWYYVYRIFMKDKLSKLFRFVVVKLI